jgi:carbamoyltransferase
MVVLSITQGHDTGATVVEDGKIVAAVSEERFSRIKMDRSFPCHSIEAVLKIAGLDYKDIDHVVIPELRKSQDIFQNVIPYYFNNVFSGNNGRLDRKACCQQLFISTALLLKTYSKMAVTYYLHEKRLRRMFSGAEFHRIEHHLAHASSTYYTSGFDRALIITGDAWGDFVSTMISIGEESRIKIIKKNYYPNSLGHYYQSLTNWLGFKGGRHEGKVLGLAAYGNPDSSAYEIVKNLLICDGLEVHAPCMMGKMWHNKIKFPKDVMMRKMKNEYKREDIAAVFQRRFEEVITELVKNCIKQLKIRNVVLAGGIFANVKLNQRIFELNGIDKVFIFPHMGDGGVSAGGALYHNIINKNKCAYRIEDAYLGPEFAEKEIENELKKTDFNYHYEKDIETKVAQLVAKSKVVARFNGRMEYGPRALGNRSILYQATDPSVNNWLNKRLGRTEFMPFAPVTLIEYADKCYINLKGAEQPAKFMTITFDCTDYMKKVSPAAVHVDGTARPQLISKNDNPGYYKIVNEYRKITGIPSIVNTSFNMHEEPIVCTPYDAIRAFKLGHLDYLAIGQFLVKGDNEES